MNPGFWKDVADDVESANRCSCCSFKCGLRCPEILAFCCMFCPLAIVGKILPTFGVFDEDVHGGGFTRFSCVESLPTILRRVAYPVEPFCFKFVQNDLSPSVLAGIRERLGKRPGLFDQVDDCQANELQCSHRVVSSCCITGVTREFGNEFKQHRLPSPELR